MEYDAVLSFWKYSINEGVMYGRISEDKKGRFTDGTTVRTSKVKEIRNGYCITRNSVYKLKGE